MRMQPDPVPSRLAGALVGAALLMFGCEDPSQAGKSPGAVGETVPATMTADGPLAVEPTTLDMGDLVPEVAVTKQVRLTNRSSAPITISRAIADCSCTDPSWPEEPIAPGETVETDITMTPGLKQGVTLTKRVTFDIEGGEPVFLTVVGRVGMFIEYGPDFLEGPSDDAEVPPAASIEFASADGTAFKITAVEPAIAVDDPTAAASAVRHAVRIDWTKWRAASKPLKFTVTTDHSKAPPLVTIIRRPVPPPPAKLQ